MKKLLLTAAAGAMLCASAVPAFAAIDSVTVHRCDGTTFDMEGEDAENFKNSIYPAVSAAAQIEVWNGCYRITEVEDGMYVTRFYDPDSRMALQ
jgi:hypothetical protein